MKRREFLLSTAAASSGLMLPACSSSGPNLENFQAEGTGLWRRDLAIVNAKILTLEPDQTESEAVLIRAGRIALVGTNEQVLDGAGSAPVLDGSGRTVVPGFVDPHVHFEMACNALSYQVACHTPPFISLAEIKQALGSKAATTPAGDWIVGRGSFSMATQVEERRLLSRLELDQVTDSHPLVLYSGFHVAMLNSLALMELGLWNNDSNLPRGAILHRDTNGTPTGIATEIWPMIPPYSAEQVINSLRSHARNIYVSKGITSISTLPLAGSDLVADQAVQGSGDLPIRLRAFYHVPHLMSLDDYIGMGLSRGFGTDMFRIGGVKIFVDGAGSDGLGRSFADFKWEQEELDKFVLKAHLHGIQLMMHAVTDPGHTMIEAAVEASLSLVNGMRPRIEHGGDIEDIDRIRRLAQLGIIPVITPPQQRATQPNTGQRKCNARSMLRCHRHNTNLQSSRGHSCSGNP